MKKQITTKLQLNKETLRNLSDRDLKNAIGGATRLCAPTGLTYCQPCATESCISGSGGSCDTFAANCC